MDQTALRPWDPDPRWADPLITLLLLLSFLGAWSALAAPRTPKSQPSRPGLQARIQELAAAAGHWNPTPGHGKTLSSSPNGPFWDRALLATLAAERGDAREPFPLPAPPSPAAERLFAQAWAAAYREGVLPNPGDLETLQEPLGGGFAYWRLRARLAERAGQDPAPFRDQARRWALPRLAALGLLGAASLGLGLVGLVAGPVFLASRKGPWPRAPLPHPGMSGRALAIVLLGWFLALRVSGMAAFALVAALHLPRALVLPLASLFHAGVGIALALRGLGMTFRDAWRTMTPGRPGPALGWALPFLGIAVAGVLAAGWLASPLTRGAESPQREILDLVNGAQNPALVLLLFLTIAGLAPLFEEWLFRGILLPWLGQRLGPRLGSGAGWSLAILASGLGFGLIHLQPAGLPTLATLGLVPGWAFRRTGNLWTAITLHASWNAGVFVFMRVLA